MEEVSLSRTKQRSPCVGRCTATSFGDAICKGCGRTFEEVVTWNQMTEQEKAAVIERLRQGLKD